MDIDFENVLARLPLPTTLLTHLTNNSTLYLSLYSRLLAFRILLQDHILNPFLTQLIYPTLLRLYHSPNILSLLLFAVVLLLSFWVLDLLRRAVMFWVRLLFRIAFWGTILAVGMYVWGRGWEGAGQDAMRWGGQVADLWTTEYRRWEEVQRGAQVGARMDGMGGRGYRGR